MAVLTDAVAGHAFAYVSTARDGEKFICLTVAVIVDAIADFGGRLDSADAWTPNSGLSAYLQTFLAGADVGAAGLFVTGVACAVLVDNSIAIVVEAIADFGLGFDSADTCTPGSVVAGLNPLTTDADIRTAGLLQIFVHEAVAVVVDAVTDFFGWFYGALTFAPFTILANHYTLTAGADISTTGNGKVFIYLAVAVVVETIADFDAGADLSRAGSPLSTDTGLNTLLAFPDVRAAGLCVTLVARATFVDFAIAVVVDSVAGVVRSLVIIRVFPVGFNSTLAGAPVPVDAGLQTGAAFSNVRPAYLEQVFIDLTVAVVVPAVADFGLGHDGSFAWAECSADTGLDTGGALADIRTAWLCDFLVDFSVAVVVKSVADLCGGFDGIHAGPPRTG